tara:strand:+ start:46 stop:723 length:678 start_codon:yes stop_codon:yes gene_type:complete
MTKAKMSKKNIEGQISVARKGIVAIALPKMYGNYYVPEAYHDGVKLVPAKKSDPRVRAAANFGGDYNYLNLIKEDTDMFALDAEEATQPTMLKMWVNTKTKIIHVPSLRAILNRQAIERRKFKRQSPELNNPHLTMVDVLKPHGAKGATLVCDEVSIFEFKGSLDEYDVGCFKAMMQNLDMDTVHILADNAGLDIMEVMRWTVTACVALDIPHHKTVTDKWGIAS